MRSVASLRLGVASLLLAFAVVALPQSIAAGAGVRTRMAAISVTDDHHARVTLSGVPRRIVALAPNVVEILYAIGMGGRVVGVSQDTDYPAAATRKPIVLSYPAGANVEKIVALHPDLLVAAGIDASYLPKLRALHLPTIVLDPSSIDGILHDITIAGTATGASAAAGALVMRLQARIEAVRARIRRASARPRVYYEFDFSKAGAYTYGRGSFGDALITLAGGDNVGRAGAGAYPLLSPEKIIGLNPQVIVLGDAAFGISASSVRGRPGFRAIAAVQGGRIYPFNDTLVSRPGPRIVDGVEAMAHLLHPEAFK